MGVAYAGPVRPAGRPRRGRDGPRLCVAFRPRDPGRVRAHPAVDHRPRGPAGERARPPLLGRRAATLIVWGDRDPILPVRHGTEAAELLPGSRFELMPGAGHFPML